MIYYINYFTAQAKTLVFDIYPILVLGEFTILCSYSRPKTN